MKDKLQSLEDKFDKNIKSLQNELKLKELQIQEYKVKDGEVNILREVVEDYKQRAENAYNETKDCKNHTDKLVSKNLSSDEEEKKSHIND